VCLVVGTPADPSGSVPGWWVEGQDGGPGDQVENVPITRGSVPGLADGPNGPLAPRHLLANFLGYRARTVAGRAATPDIRGDSLEAIISLRGVWKSFGSHTVLQDVSFDVPKGKITAIMGPSGTGKSVMLKNIIGLLRPEQGEIWVDGDQIVGMGERELYEVRKKFGVLFQDGALFGSLNLYDNIAFPLREHTKMSERDIREIVLEKADMVGLLDHMKKFPGEVSGGMKKRAGLARALVTDPEIVLFDEPDSGLDPVRVAYLDELVTNLQAETGKTFFIITHNIPSVMRTADYIGVLFRSFLVKFEAKDDMRESKNPIIRQFLAGKSMGPIGMDEMSDAGNEVDIWADDENAEPYEVLTV
jgi:phospholipid/cholesterol/gamma-HCH transport system ATP-binding protein